MNKIAVNPTQFITCRLCLEELGNYQIVPSLKEQIDYCFGINIEPYDGLPQLICEKCEVILSNYSRIKKKFIEKQDELRSKIQQNSTQGKLSGAQQHTGGSRTKFEYESNKENRGLPTKKNHCISSSSSDQECSNTFQNIRSKRDNFSNEERSERDGYGTEEIDDTWPASYTKQFVCRICSSHWSSIKALRNHINKIHGRIYKNFKYVFKRHCLVKLHKIDGKPNVTGSKSKVVYSKEKIVKNVYAEYHIIYTTKDYKGDDRYHESDDEVRKVKSKKRNKNSHFISDSSDEDIVVTRKRKKRIYSSSSNETVVLDCKPNVSDNDEESQKTDMIKPPAACIDLTDSSDTESEKSMIPKKTTPEIQLSNKDEGGRKAHKVTINDIIVTCRTKYQKKLLHENTKNSPDIANKLQHKMFSIGRKIINKRIGVNCTPLMRFMEHKNLDIAWLSREIVNVTESSNYIRIMPRRKNIKEKLEESETGWTYDTSTQINSSMSYNSELSHSPLNVHNGNSSPENPSVSTSDAAVITYDATHISTETKLLNENPVANPKQLPKKFATTEAKLVKLIPKPLENSPQEDNNSDMCMPIITSTTSLAVHYSIQDDDDDSNKRSDIDGKTTDKQQVEPPRIKVKPASELMSVEMLNRMQNPMQNYTQGPTKIPITIIGKGVPVSVSVPVLNLSSPVSVPVTVTSQNMLQPNNDTMASLTAHQSALQSEFMILDTIELPNTRTNSPYLYFKKLLQIHNIILLDTHVELPEDFNCLLKFKVMYRQNTQIQPVTLCLGLFCSTNIFCLKIKDRNDENLDITKMSPNWQWEILKVYKGEVVNKLLNCAQKISQAVHAYANSFVCILKSINVK